MEFLHHGAGQILTFYLIFILKQDTHKSRAISVCILSISSIFSLIGYIKFVSFDFKIVITLSVISIFSGIIGAKLMKKISSNTLNLVSGIIIVSLTLYKILSKG